MAKIKTLRRCPLFRSLSYRDLAVLAPFLKEEKSKKNGVLADEGQPTRGLFIVKQGSVRLSSSRLGATELDLREGEFFGELSLVNGDQAHNVKAKAIDSCEYLRLDPNDYLTLRNQDPNVAGKIAQGIIEVTSQKVLGMQGALTELLQSEKSH